MKRREERKHTLCLVFGLSFEIGFFDMLETSKYEQAMQLYLETNELSAPNRSKQYILNNYEGVATHIDAIDDIITKNLKGWTLPRLNKVDIAILRLSVYELMFAETPTPGKVIANEAVELAKELSSDEAPAFINGILAGLITTNKEETQTT